MPKEEIALELTKLIADKLIRECKLANSDIAKFISEAYMNVYNNLNIPTQE
ncbi:hypothetical protein Clole_0790 [Cellulosilyticum lentocellum DSM 5427]|uniref:Uncharacterized protein n=2 Tax=Cellulosilyticum lentocellum TaxID=29360 RepID=F2JPH5_CELLD|nr:hypothetical protein Clole_0790 [Cellulosilyticum lentocellum DSM 5427]